VDTWDHPGADQILAQYNLKVFRGDGHLIFAAARPISGDQQCDVGQVQVQSLQAVEPFGYYYYYCFRTVGTRGYLTLEVPGTFAIRGGNQAIRATVELPSGDRTYDELASYDEHAQHRSPSTTSLVTEP
jgi:hypothetical protein